MAYDRYDTRDAPRDERSRWRDERDRGWRGDERGRHEDRGFFERAGDEIASWFGDDEAERRRREDQMRDERSERRGMRDEGRGWDRDRERGRRDWSEDRGWSREQWSRGDRDEGRFRSREDERFRDRGRDYRPLMGDYDRGRETEPFFAGASRRSERSLDEEPPRSRGFGGTRGERSPFDPHYRSWRERHLSELDRDYDEYSRENQSRFEREFGTWRERRQQKRGLLGQIREHMEVVGSDEQHVGTVDRIAGDRVILAKSDPESGGVHHSLSCSDIDRVEGDRVILECAADEARNRWRDESRSRALFEREDQGEMGPRMLDRSFEGTYR